MTKDLWPGPSMKNKFTLIELLVAVAIIGILLSILLPSLDKAREKARRAVCKSNLSQIYKSVLIYSMDNKDRIFTGTSWGSYQDSYMINVGGNPSGLTHNVYYVTGIMDVLQKGIVRCNTTLIVTLGGVVLDLPVRLR
jgi:prepilin-type N-terminal cleavage/methylation domain-containing protein